MRRMVNNELDRVTVVLSSGTDTFLGIKSALQLGHFRVRIDSAEKDCFILVEYYASNETVKMEACLIHSSICEKQSGVVVRDCWRRRDICMPFRLEKGEKFLADL